MLKEPPQHTTHTTTIPAYIFALPEKLESLLCFGLRKTNFSICFYLNKNKACKGDQRQVMLHQDHQKHLPL